MSNDEQLHRLLKARYDFAAAVMAYHQAGCDDDALLDRMSECERAYLDTKISHAAPGLAAAFARRERNIDQLRNPLGQSC